MLLGLEKNISSEKENFKRKKYVHCGPNYFRIVLFQKTFLIGFHFSQLFCACSDPSQFPNAQSQLRALFGPICSLLGLCSPKGFLCQSTWLFSKERSLVKWEPENPTGGPTTFLHIPLQIRPSLCWAMALTSLRERSKLLRN